MIRCKITLLPLFVATLCVFVQGCKENTPITPVTPAATGVIIVNEGQYQTDNASLSLYDDSTGTTVKDWFGSVNVGVKLGATANDIVRKGDTAYVAVTDSRTIEVVQISTGKSLGRVNMGLLSTPSRPRKITLINDTLGCVSTYMGNGVLFFNTRTYVMLGQVITGPATEGIASNGTNVFVANSGLGDLAKDNPGAGTVSVVDISTRNVVATLDVGVNVTELVMNTDKSKLYAYFQHSYKKPDSLQGVVEYDANTFKELRRWRFKSMGNMRFYNNDIYVFNVSGFSSTKILKINLQNGSGITDYHSIEPAILSPYGFSFNPTNGNLYITDAKDYVSNGEVRIYNKSDSTLNGKFVKTLTVGVNPKSMLFY